MRTHGDKSPVYGYELRLRGLAPLPDPLQEPSLPKRFGTALATPKNRGREESAQAGFVSVERHFNAGHADYERDGFLVIRGLFSPANL